MMTMEEFLDHYIEEIGKEYQIDIKLGYGLDIRGWYQDRKTARKILLAKIIELLDCEEEGSR
jgi:hypothetical protein